MALTSIFVDKDGTLVRDIPYNVDPDKIEAVEGCRLLARLSRLGYLLVVVSNQSGVARGYFDEEALRGVETSLREVLAAHGVTLDGFYYCPHHPDGDVVPYNIECNCRKPRPGMLLRAAADLDIDLAASWMVGDILDDVEAGARAGCRTILVDTGNETEWVGDGLRRPDAVTSDLAQAVKVIETAHRVRHVG